MKCVSLLIKVGFITTFLTQALINNLATWHINEINFKILNYSGETEEIHFSNTVFLIQENQWKRRKRDLQEKRLSFRSRFDWKEHSFCQERGFFFQFTLNKNL